MLKNVIKSIVLLLTGVVLLSCDGKNDSRGPKTENLIITFDKNVVKPGETVKLQVYYKGEDVTSSAALYNGTGTDFNDVLMDKTSFSLPEVGKYYYWAGYKGEVSEVITIHVTDRDLPVVPQDPKSGSSDFVHRTFFNQHTGQDCQYCPRMVRKLNSVLSDPAVSDKVVLSVIRNYNSKEAGFANIKNPSGGWPYLVIDNVRSLDYDDRDETFKALINDRTSTAAAAGIAAKADWYEETKEIVVTVAVKAAVAAEYNVGLWLMQDKYYADQTVPDSSFSGDTYNWHDNCVRVAESKYLGAHVGYPLGFIDQKDVRRWTYILKVDDSWFKYITLDYSKLHFAAFLME